MKTKAKTQPKALNQLIKSIHTLNRKKFQKTIEQLVLNTELLQHNKVLKC